MSREAIYQKVFYNEFELFLFTLNHCHSAKVFRRGLDGFSLSADAHNNMAAFNYFKCKVVYSRCHYQLKAYVNRIRSNMFLLI